MKAIIILVGTLFLLTTIISATEVNLFMPENQAVFTTNEPVLVGIQVTGSKYPISCAFEEKGSNRYFEPSDDVFWFWEGYSYYLRFVNSGVDRWWYGKNLYNGRYKLQAICTDANGNVGESEIIKFHVKGDMKWA